VTALDIETISMSANMILKMHIANRKHKLHTECWHEEPSNN